LFQSQCSSHAKISLSRPWSVLYLGPDSEIDDGANPISNSTSSFCCYCGSPTNRPRLKSRVNQSLKVAAAPAEHKPPYQQQQSTNYHAYANLIRGGNGSSTLPSISRRAHHHQTAPVVFPAGKLGPSAARDVPDSGNRRGAFYTSSTSCSTSQASSPSSPQTHTSYCNLSAGTGPACLPPNPLKYPLAFQEERGAYANLQHLPTSLTPSPFSTLQQYQTRWRSSRPSNDLIPDEIREPRRNYALVDLRPSPASSVITPGDIITLVSTSEDALSINSETTGSGMLVGSGGNKTDSSASTLHTNTSTSSSAATIVSNGGGNRPRTASNHRRTLSHSLTAVLPVPTLNYVHIMTKKDATAAAAVSTSTNPSSLVGCESPASSSSTASSSEKEQRAPIVPCPNPCSSSTIESQVPYAQIDFERTRALNAVNGTSGSSEMGHFHHNHQQKGLGGQSIVSKNASIVGIGGGLRGLNMRKKSSDGLQLAMSAQNGYQGLSNLSCLSPGLSEPCLLSRQGTDLAYDYLEDCTKLSRRNLERLSAYCIQKLTYKTIVGLQEAWLNLSD
uniref:PDZ domain-containing protein n=1 Tax=Rodentolepis nana TaxID=102285 RepID=A0A0R3TCM7_RODNA